MLCHKKLWCCEAEAALPTLRFSREFSTGFCFAEDFLQILLKFAISVFFKTHFWCVFL